jgi:hypothetical protein
MANRIRITKRRQELFLAELRKHGNVTRAAETVQKTRGAMYWLKEHRPEFSAAWDETIEAFMDGVESEALRRAAVGVQRPIFYKGEKVGEITEYSDRLMEFLLDRRRYPSKTRLEHTGANGGAIILQAEPHDDTL